MQPPKALYDLRHVQGLAVRPEEPCVATSSSGSAVDLELQEQIPSTSRWVSYVLRVLFRFIFSRESCEETN